MWPIADIPWAQVDINASPNPLPHPEAAEFAETKRYRRQPSSHRSMLSLIEQALLFTLIRNQQPDHVVEIALQGRDGGGAEPGRRRTAAGGCTPSVPTTWRASPSDALAGTVAQDAGYIRWTRCPSCASMSSSGRPFSRRQSRLRICHLDLRATASRWRAGFVFVTGASWPPSAVQDFIRDHPEWHDCRVISPSGNAYQGLRSDRTTIRMPTSSSCARPRATSPAAGR